MQNPGGLQTRPHGLQPHTQGHAQAVHRTGHWPGAARRGLLFAAFLAVFIMLCTATFPAEARERFTRFDVQAEVLPDGRVRITESFVLMVEHNKIRRGFYRDIPLRWVGGDSSYIIDITVESVTRKGQPEPWYVERSGSLFSIVTGDDTLLPRGANSYTITYVVANAITREQDSAAQQDTGEQAGEQAGEHTGEQAGPVDEFYWNVLGTDTGFSVEAASFSLSLPDAGTHRTPQGRDARIQEINAYTGAYGSSASDARILPDGSVRTTRALLMGEGFTVSYAWPAGLTTGIARPWNFAAFLQHALLPDAAGWYFPLVVLASLLILLACWRKYGKDPAMPTIIPRFDAPDGMTPGMLRAVRHSAWDASCLVADILNLATKGRLRIEKGQGSVAYVLCPTAAHPGAGATAEPSLLPPLLPEEEKLLTTLLPRSDSVLPLHESKHAVLAAARRQSYIQCMQPVSRTYTANTPLFLLGLSPFLLVLYAVYHSHGPQGLLISLASPFITALFLAFFHRGAVSASPLNRMGLRKRLGTVLPILFAFGFGLFAAWLLNKDYPQSPPGWLGTLWCALILALIFSFLMPRHSREGVALLAEIEGLALYMDVAEQHRLAALYPPADSAERFERLLPFALALDTATTWANRFDTYLQQHTLQAPPSIAFAAHDRNWPRTFSRTMRSFGHSYRTASIDPTRKASGVSGGGGRSGMRGGGFSGGGRGGGGFRGR